MRRVLELLLLFLPSPIPQILVSFSLFFSIHFTSLHFVSFHPFIAPPPPPNPKTQPQQVANILVNALFSALVMVKPYTLLTLIHILL